MKNKLMLSLILIAQVTEIMAIRGPNALSNKERFHQAYEWYVAQVQALNKQNLTSAEEAASRQEAAQMKAHPLPKGQIYMQSIGVVEFTPLPERAWRSYMDANYKFYTNHMRHNRAKNILTEIECIENGTLKSPLW